MEEKEIKQSLMLINRRRLSIDAVTNIEALGDDYVEVTSDAGRILIEGEGLRIEELNRAQRTVNVVGLINNISYKNIKRNDSFISRWFK